MDGATPRQRLMSAEVARVVGCMQEPLGARRRRTQVEGMYGNIRPRSGSDASGTSLLTARLAPELDDRLS